MCFQRQLTCGGVTGWLEAVFMHHALRSEEVASAEKKVLSRMGATGNAEVFARHNGISVHAGLPAKPAAPSSQQPRTTWEINDGLWTDPRPL